MSIHSLNFEGQPLRNPFWRELEEEGSITFRDNYQFELKSEFYVDPDAAETHFTQEFYLFIPETLQINPHTYSVQQFYHDQLNLIRYKTPNLTLKELIDPENRRSPLYRIQSCENKQISLDEMMLYGNIYRTSLRFRIRNLLKDIRYLKIVNTSEMVQDLLNDVINAKRAFTKTKFFLIDHFRQKRFVDQLNYIDEFMSVVSGEYLSLLLLVLREQNNPELQKIDSLLADLIRQEETHRQKLHPDTKDDSMKEALLYRQGLLEKFMLSSLKLKNTRVEIRQQYGNLIGMVAAGVAMFVYMILFVWQISTIVNNTAPFVFFAVFFYIIKDRIKEGMKMLYSKHFSRWFPDYKTWIYNNQGKIIGRVSETFSFIPRRKLPEGVYQLRVHDAEDKLEFHQPNETIIQYKKAICLNNTLGRLTELTTIFRYDIHHFLEKANDALQPTLKLNHETGELEEHLLAKVYHLNLILKNNFLDARKQRCEEIKTFMVVIDKTRIKRVEQISSQLRVLEAPSKPS